MNVRVKTCPNQVLLIFKIYINGEYDMASLHAHKIRHS
jgi:hypothetical protein